jgi:HEAT repeats
MDKYLIELIDRMNGVDEWNALREAEKLNDVNQVQQLMDFIDVEKDKEKRDRAYFVLGHLAKNTGDLSTGQYMINRIELESDKYVIGFMLDRLENVLKPESTDLTPLLNATKSKKWLIRHGAISALKNTNNKAVEDRLLEILKTSSDVFDLEYAARTLNTTGSKKSIPHLEKLFDLNKNDLSAIALGSIMNIGGADEIELYRDRAVKGRAKTYALSGIMKFGNTQDVPIIKKRVKQIVSKKRTMKSNLLYGASYELLELLKFIKQYESKEGEFHKLLESILTNKKDMILKEELNWVEQEYTADTN